MGWRGRWKAAGATYRDIYADGVASAQKWARITEVGQDVAFHVSTGDDSTH
jgi:hypothetical protein